MIDLIYILLLSLALWKGLRKGLVVAFFSFVAVFVGLAAALKLSASVAQWLQTTANVSASWLPFISFALVMVAVFILVRWSASIIEKALDIIMLGWLNKIGGVVLYIALYTTVYSVLLFYLNGFGLIKKDAIDGSKCYAFIQPWAPKLMGMWGEIVPMCKNMFEQLQQYFGGLSR